MIRAVIFDMDGVIIDSEPIISQSYDILLRSMGKNPVAQAHGLVHAPGIRGEEVWKELLERYDIKTVDIDDLRKKRREIYLRLLEEQTEPMKGVRECIGMLVAHGIKLAIASGSQPHIIHHILEKFGLRAFFPVIISGKDVAKGKPDPESFVKAAEQLGVDSSDCIVIEDGEPGVIAAKRAGMKVIAVSHQFSKHNNFSQANLVVQSLDKLTMASFVSL